MAEEAGIQGGVQPVGVQPAVLSPGQVVLDVNAARRRGGLIAWGVVWIVLGALMGLGGIGMLAGMTGVIEQGLVQATVTGGSAGRARRAQAMNILSKESVLVLGMMLVFAGGLVWTGIGSCLGRRWVRPVVVNVAGLVMAGAIIGVVWGMLQLPSMMAYVDEQAMKRRMNSVSDSVFWVTMIRLAMILVVGVVVPWLAWRFYLSEKTARLLDELDPRRLWTDKAEISVLGWAGFAGLVGLGYLVDLPGAKVVAFVAVFGGAAGIVSAVMFSIVLLWTAWLCYRKDRLGWILSFVLLVGLRASTATYYWQGGKPADLFDGAKSLAMERSALVKPWWHAGTVTTLECVMIGWFGIYVSRYFRKGYSVGVVRAQEGVT